MAEDEKVTEVSMLFGLCVVPLKTKLWIGPIGLLAFVMRCCFESCKKLLLSWFKYVLKKFTFSSLFCFFFSLQPEELEALHSHTFRLKTFKKTKHCSACKQIIVEDGLICRGQCPVGKTLECER